MILHFAGWPLPGPELEKHGKTWETFSDRCVLCCFGFGVRAMALQTMRGVLVKMAFFDFGEADGGGGGEVGGRFWRVPE